MATQNPIETEGTYPLPEAQVDRFMMKVLVGYPAEEEEFVIVADHRHRQRCCSGGDDRTTKRAPRECRGVYVDPSLMQYAVRLASATRDPDRFGLFDLGKFVSFGAGPRHRSNRGGASAGVLFQARLCLARGCDGSCVRCFSSPSGADI